MSSITFKDIKIIDAVCLVVAVVFTAVRLVLRFQSGRVWWDDALALLSSLCSILTSTATGMHYGDPYAYTRVTRLAAYYLIAEGFYLTLWTARLSILFSIIRIVPEKTQKRFLYRTAIAFVVVLVFLLAQVFWVCERPHHTSWKNAPNPQCSLGLQVAVCQLVTDIISDVLLIFVPVRLLARTNLERGLKIRLLIIFSAAMLTTVVSLVHAAYLLEVRGIDAIVSALVEVSVCLIVCNLVVVVPAMYRAFGWRSEEDPHAHGDGEAEPSFRISSFRFGPARSWAASGTDRSSLGVGPGLSTGTGFGTGTGGVSTSDHTTDPETAAQRRKEEGVVLEGDEHTKEAGKGNEAKVRWDQSLSGEER